MLADAASGAVDDGAGGNGNASTGSAIPGPGSENTSGSKQGSAAAAGSGSKTAGDSSAGKGATGGKTGGASGGAVAGTSGSGTSGGGQPGGGPGQPQPGAAGIPGLPNLTLGQQPQSIAEKRGERNWANPAANHSSFPVTRPIKVVCDADHLTMLPEGRSRRGYKVIEFDKSSEESVRELVESVWQRVDTWGAAGQGMYWRPELLMEIEPGGEKRFAELKALLADSGLDVRGRARQSPSIRYPRTRTPN